MLHEKIVDMLNFQVNREFYSAYLYRDIANYFEYKGLGGFAHWYNIQAAEEKEHAILMMQYLLDNGCRVKLLDVEAPGGDYENFVSPVQVAYDHEVQVTKWIHEIYGQAMKDSDYRTVKFLDFFVTEQGEEEKNAADVLAKTKAAGEEMKFLYMVDAELKTRQYTQTPGIRSAGVN